MEHSDSSPPSIRINPTVAGVPEEHLLDEIRQVITTIIVDDINRMYEGQHIFDIEMISNNLITILD